MLYFFLHRYILGVNTESITVPVTKPIIQKRLRVSADPSPKGAKFVHEMCFWAGSEYASKEMPGAVEKNLFIIESKPFSAYVRCVHNFLKITSIGGFH